MNTKSWFSGLKSGVSQFTKLSKELLAESLHQDEGNAYLDYISFLTDVSIFLFCFAVFLNISFAR